MNLENSERPRFELSIGGWLRIAAFVSLVGGIGLLYYSDNADKWERKGAKNATARNAYQAEAAPTVCPDYYSGRMDSASRATIAWCADFPEYASKTAPVARADSRKASDFDKLLTEAAQ